MKLLPCIFILLFQSFLDAQYKEHIFEKVTIEIDGETIFDVSEITQDHQGYLWLETNLGLIRYDGIEGKKYNIGRGDSSIISNEFIRALHVDSRGDLWIGANSGLIKYQPGCDCMHFYPTVIDGIPMTMIRAITEDRGNNIWIGTRIGHLFHYDRTSGEFSNMLQKELEDRSIIDTRIGNLMVDHRNKLWIGTNSGLVVYDIDSENSMKFLHDPSNPNSLTDNIVRALYEDKDGKIFIGTFHSGLHVYDPKTELLKRIPHNKNNLFGVQAPYTEETVFGEPPHVNLIHRDQSGDYWIGTTGAGVNQINIGKKTISHYDLDLVNPQILWDLYEDRQGNLWLGGGMGAGLYKTDLYAGSYHLNTSITNVETAFESPHNPGVLWVMSQENGLGKIDLNTNQVTQYLPDPRDETSIGHKWVRSVYQEDEKTVWVGLGNGGAYGNHDGNGGLDRLDLTTGKFTHFRMMRDDDGMDGFGYTVYNISEDKEGRLWLGTGPGGIFRSDKDKKVFTQFKNIVRDTSFQASYLNIVYVDTNGDVWASDFAGDGTLYLYDRKDDQLTPYLNGFKMSNIMIDENGWMWISTWEKGLVHLNPEDRSYTLYTKEDGLPSLEALDIINGDDGIIWISSRAGCARMDTKTGEISPIGLPKMRYNFRILKASNGRLYVGSNNGLYSFPSDQAYKNPFAPQVAIHEMVIADNNYLSGASETENLSFSHDQDDITFRYAGLHFSNALKNSYEYRLKPINSEWVKAGDERTARYFNLPPGEYTFEVKAANSDGVWSETPETVHFTITPAWWMTWWAYIIYVLALAFIIERIYRFRLSKKMADAESKRLMEVDKLKNALYTNITHEFRTPLTVIKGMTDSIKSDLGEQKIDNLDHSLEIIDRNSDGLLNLINEMLDLAKIESGNMELNLVQVDIIPYLKYLTHSFESLAQGKGIDFNIQFRINQLNMDLDVNKFTAIVNNLLSNAIKFTPDDGRVDVLVDVVQLNKRDQLILVVEDNGIGISIEEQAHIFDKFYQADSTSSRLHKGSGIGLSLVKEFIELMKGTITVESEKNKGTRFRMVIPITKEATMTSYEKIISALPVMDSALVVKAVKSNPTEVLLDDKLPLVLIIEDNPDVAHYINTCLKELYKVLHAENGAIGIEMALNNIPDVVISDVMMPEKDGFEVCEYLKTNELTDHIPIIMLTAKATFEDRLTGLSHGADAYLTKPFAKAELLTRIEQLILLRKKMLSKFEKTGIDRLLQKKEKTSESRFLNKVISVINENLQNPGFGPLELANHLHFSESQLYRKLKATSGKSTAIFIRSIRVQIGKDLLVTTNKSISEVAYEVGFNDPSYFSRAFKKEFGHTPSEVGR